MLRSKTTTRNMPDSADRAQTLFLDYLDRSARTVDAAMKRHLPGPRVRPRVVHEAMRYTALSAGKRLRPSLVLLAAETAGGDSGPAEPVAAALEFVHAFSLIHDDLPCMDDDDERRGQPSNHVVYGEGTAVLAGDALLTLAFEVVAEQAEALGPDTTAALTLELARATGSRGVVGGQVMDLQCEGRDVDLRTVQFIHARKTGRLFECALRLGALAGGASDPLLEALGRFGARAGTAFQIVDDILSEAGTAQSLGRKPGRDAIRGKATYPRVQGLKKSQAAVSRLLREAEGQINALPARRDLYRGFLALIDRRRRDAWGGLRE